MINTSGEPLDTQTRQFFEPRFGHDFSHVRIHRDAAAAQSAASVSALAYTVGHHIVFGSGRYRPEAHSGRSLLAHELTHVLQQGGTVQRAAASSETDDVDAGTRPALRVQRAASELHGMERTGQFPDPISENMRTRRGGTLSYRDSMNLLAEVELQERMEAEAEAAEEACRQRTPPDPVECNPDRDLEWSDFAASAPGRSRFGAMTAFDLRERPVNAADHACARGGSTLPRRGIQAQFDPARSWVKARYAQAADVAHNGCTRSIQDCEATFAGLGPGQTGTYALNPGGGCAAAVAPAGHPATNRSECTTVVGADCTTTAVAESARLLNHERWHFKLACEIASKANAMLATTPDFDALLRTAQGAANNQTRRYDNQTGHGCNAAQQASWEAEIAAGLPSLTLTVTPARRRRRR
ncbi:DUF4157 domain-containing protein [Luteimonas kalidii]|uniref:DUF4157 domain-containing protein n=1 Tax=Luteimonas kalidii TaxID=3042025 RepID=A0ABT6JT60_9GAMM|nr:DUF4157 domain-containing protein [Luteimonas kalidii]MDH5833682.1 DUF4157 domain-containing protein [Luteimonas kalidii]